MASGVAGSVATVVVAAGVVGIGVVVVVGTFHEELQQDYPVAQLP